MTDSNALEILPPREELVQEWLVALRSGEYTQAHGSLRTDTGYCCLGVVCDLAARHGYGAWVGNHFYASSEYYMGVLPLELAEYLEITKGGRLDGFELTLVELNDSTLAPFGEIADILEAHV